MAVPLLWPRHPYGGQMFAKLASPRRRRETAQRRISARPGLFVQQRQPRVQTERLIRVAEAKGKRGAKVLALLAPNGADAL